MDAKYIELRRLVLPHDASFDHPCDTCDKRWEKIEAEIERLVGVQVLEVIARKARLTRMRGA